MQKANADRSAQDGVKGRQPWAVRLGLLAVAWLLALVLGAVALNSLVPSWPRLEKGVRARVSWYFCHGQFLADTHTLARMAEYLLRRESPARPASHHRHPVVAGVTNSVNVKDLI